jgi:CubicO group peptidase (beta-lactamase class C family)
MQHSQNVPRAIAAIVLCVALANAGCGEDASRQESQSAPADGFEDVRALIKKRMRSLRLPSIAVAVAKDGIIVWEEAWGYANTARKIEATPQTMYSLASVSKPITATGLMTLVERGLVDLDKPANDYLGPATLTGYAGDASQATVQRILNHTAGLPQHWNIMDAQDSLRRDMDETIRRYGILVTPPGTVFTYSNLGYGIIDYIISRTSGQSYPEFMKSEVFEPLGMTHSAVLTHQEQGTVIAHRYDSNRWVPFLDFDHRGASAVYASAHDLARFGMFHLKSHLPDQRPILSDAGIDAMQSAVDSSLPQSQYALGWSVVDVSGYHFVNHNGGMPGVTTRLTLVPEENLVCVVLSNGGGADLWDIEWAILRAMIPGLPEKPDLPSPPPPPKKFVPPDSLLGEWIGTIKADGRSVPAQIEFRNNGKVTLIVDGKKHSPLKVKTPLGKLTFADGTFHGPFMGRIKTTDTARRRHVIVLDVQLRGDTLSGSASAVAMNERFCFAHWIELVRKRP